MTEAAETTKRAAPWRGVKRTDAPRDAWVHVRLTQAQLAAVRADAARAGLSVGALARHHLTGSAGPRAVRTPPVDRVELARVLAALGRVGSNVNQLARAANMDEIPARDELAAAVAAVLQMRDALMQALGRGD